MLSISKTDPVTNTEQPNSSSGTPLFAILPTTGTYIKLPINQIAVVKYIIRNNAVRTLNFDQVKPIAGVKAIVDQDDNCIIPQPLASNESCILSLAIEANNMINNISSGPQICSGVLNCYTPSIQDQLNIEKLE